MKPFPRFATITLCLALAAGVLIAAEDGVPQGSPSAPPLQPAPAQPTLTLSPAVVLAIVQPGQGVTQTFRMSNLTPLPFRFEVEVQDVAVKDGKRTFVPAGETRGSIAATAIASPRAVAIAPQAQGSVTVTLTMPQDTSLRAVVVYFRGKIDKPAEGGKVALGAALGALYTFGLSQDYKVEAVNFSSAPQTDTTNLSISHELVNSGREIVVPKGATAILDEAGRRVSKATFDPLRLLPGERLEFRAINPSQLKPGRYRVVSSFEYEGKILTTEGAFSVP